jgi:uncharacterized RDD family membrane protein YckC
VNETTEVPTFEVPPAGDAAHAVPADPWAPPPVMVDHHEFAGWGSRVAAALVDVVVLGLPLTVLTIVAATAFIPAAANYSEDGATPVFFLFLVFGPIVAWVVAALYSGFLMGRPGTHNGQTLGKQALGIRVVRTSGQPISFWYATLREGVVKGLVSFIGSFVFYIPTLLDCLWPLWDRDNRALHDMVVSTRVVKA